MTEMAATDRARWVPDDSTFGARLALVRQHMGWGNVKEAADACGLPVESWRRWERDGRAPRDIVEIADTISERTGCDFGWLLAGRRLADKQRNAATLRYRPPASAPINASPRNSRRPIRSQPDERLAA